MTADDTFCDECEVSMDLHDDPDSCESAEMRARVIERFGALR